MLSGGGLQISSMAPAAPLQPHVVNFYNQAQFSFQDLIQNCHLCWDCERSWGDHVWCRHL